MRKDNALTVSGHPGGYLTATGGNSSHSVIQQFGSGYGGGNRSVMFPETVAERIGRYTYNAVDFGKNLLPGSSLPEVGDALRERSFKIAAVLLASELLGPIGKELRAAKAIANPVSDTLARVVPRNLNPTMLGKPGDLDVFVTNASELRGLSNAQIAEKLAIPEIPGGFKVIEFSSSSVQGIASPVFRTNPGFVHGGRTAGGAAEFVIPNGPIPAGAIQWIPRK